jgi:hydroxymethylpyrimidine/phosphomethylpyrimidine kinase
MTAKQNEAKLLVDLLGHEHDLSVLTQTVNENPEEFGTSDTLALLIAAIITRQQALRQEALTRAETVFQDDPVREGKIIEMLWSEAS